MKKSVLIVALFSSIILAVSIAFSMPIAPTPEVLPNIGYPLPFVPAQILIMPKDNIPLSSLTTLNEQYNAQMKMVGRELGIYRIDFPLPVEREDAENAYNNGLTELLELYKETAISHVLDMVEAYEESGLVEWAAPNHYVYIHYTPNDPYFRDASSFPNSSQPDQHGLWRTQANGGCDARPGWDNTTGISSILIGDADSGLDFDHPDIQANLWTNPGEIPNNGIDDDGNGYTDDYHGYDFIGDWIGDLWGSPNEDPDPDVYYPDPACGNGEDDNLDGYADIGVPHGTMTSGCAGAVMDNSAGITGSCGHSPIVMARAINPEGGGTDETIASSIDYLTTVGVDVINLSLGSSASLPATATAVTAAYNSGISVICASGNSGDNTTMYPASMPEALAVGSANTSNGRAYFSTYGSWLDVMAPGGETDAAQTQIMEGIWTSYVASVADTAYGMNPGEAYIAGGVGTSFASPHCAGLVALIKALHPSYTPTEVYNLLMNTAYDLPPAGFDQETGYGRIDFAPALAGIAEEEREREIPFILSVSPNVSSSLVTIFLHTKVQQNTTITIYDIRGRMVKSFRPSGNLTIWDLTNQNGITVGNGIYFVTADNGHIRQSAKVTVVSK
jgi:subtilisin family serine protease